MDDNGLGHEHIAAVLSRRDNNPTGGKGMKIARAAKRLAMLITVVALAVVTMACQGAVGPKGDDGPIGPQGPPGDDGAAGTPGQQGPSGDTPFIPLPTAGPIKATTISSNPSKDGDYATAPASVDVSQYFSGGIGEKSYEILGQRIWGTDAELDVDYGSYSETDTFAAAVKWFSGKIADDGVTLVFSVPETVAETPVGSAPEEFVANRSVILLQATDEDDNKALHLLIVGNNRGPRVPSGVNLPDNFRIGVQPDSVRGATAS